MAGMYKGALVQGAKKMAKKMMGKGMKMMKKLPKRK